MPSDIIAVEEEKSRITNPSAYYERMDQCAAHTGIPITKLTWAKSEGCTAFRHGRIYLLDFIRWYFSQEEGDQLTPKDRLALAQAVKVERENSEAAEQVMQIAEVEKQLAESHLLPWRQWCDGLPARIDIKCNPDNPALARAALSAEVEEGRKMLRELISK